MCREMDVGCRDDSEMANEMAQGYEIVFSDWTIALWIGEL